MKTIILLGATLIGGVVRYPIEGAQTVPDDEAQRLVEAGLVEIDEDLGDDESDADEEHEDELEKETLPELNRLAVKEGVPLNGATKKADIITAIRAHRASKEA